MRGTARPLPRAVRLALCAGSGCVGGAALGVAHPPYGAWAAAPLAAAVLSGIALRAKTDGEACAGGLAFGFAAYSLMLGWLFAGVDTSAAPWLAFAGPSVVICAFAVVPALAAVIARRVPAPAPVRVCLLMPAVWTLSEWARGFTAFRFPWGHVGYSQIPESPVAPLAPLVGVLGLGFVTMAAGGLIALAVLGARLRALAALLALAGAARLAASIEWTAPVGAPVTVALLQGAFPTAEKFEPHTVADALETYARLALDTRAPLAIMPETALPLLEHVFPAGYFDALERRARIEGRDVLVTFFRDRADSPGGYHSSARVLGASGRQDYDKRILAPFGEFVPAPALLRPLYERVATVPMLDTTPGTDDQAPLVLAGVRVALRLCFEDLFGDAHRDELAQARLLVVLANDSWNGTDSPMHQHLRVAQARAAEAAKPLVRVANTGWTGAIGPDGRIVASAPLHERAQLDVTVQPHAGATPYVRHGDAIPVGMALLALVASLATLRPSAPPELAGSAAA